MKKSISLLGLAVMCCLVLSNVRADETKPGGKPAPDPKRFASEIESFEKWDSKNAWPENGVLFAGSSSMRLWPTRESFPELPVINRGFGGAQIPDVLHYYDTVVKRYAPQVILLYCGDNDVAAGRSVDQVVSDFATFLERANKDFPDTRVIYVPIKPSILRWDRWPEMREANDRIRKMADKDANLLYADTASVLLGENGKPSKNYFVEDGLHLNSEGYRVWTNVLKPVIDVAIKGK